MAKKAISTAQEQLAQLEGKVLLSDNLMGELNKKMGKTAYSLGEEDAPTDITALISTGSTILDTILTNGKWSPQGGFPVRRLVEIAGNTSAGKSLLANHCLIECQRRGGIPILIDVENTTDVGLLKRMGLKVGDDAVKAGLQKLVYLSDPKLTVTRVFETIEYSIKKVRELGSKQMIVVVWDSIAATPSDEEAQGGSYEQEGYGTQKPKQISQAMRMVTQFIGKEDVLLIFTNQLRQNMNRFGHGEMWITPGGQAVPFHSSIRVRLTKLEDIKKGEIVIGVRVQAHTKKNKIAPPYRKCTFDIYFDKGIDDVSSWFQNLVDHELVKQIGGKKSQTYSITLPSGETEFVKRDWHSTIAPHFDYVKQLVVNANMIDYANLTPTTLEDFDKIAQTPDEIGEDGNEIE